MIEKKTPKEMISQILFVLLLPFKEKTYRCLIKVNL